MKAAETDESRKQQHNNTTIKPTILSPPSLSTAFCILNKKSQVSLSFFLLCIKLIHLSLCMCMCVCSSDLTFSSLISFSVHPSHSITNYETIRQNKRQDCPHLIHRLALFFAHNNYIHVRLFDCIIYC